MIDPKLVEQWFEAWIQSRNEGRNGDREHVYKYIAQCAYEHGLEEAAKVCEEMPPGMLTCDFHGSPVDGYVAKWKMIELILALKEQK